jgi:hypothetical protein
VALAFYGIERYAKGVDVAVSVAQSAKAQRALADRGPRPLRIGGVSFLASTGARVDLVDRRVEYRALFEEALAAAKRSAPIALFGTRRVRVISLPAASAERMPPRITRTANPEGDASRRVGSS